MIRLLQIEWLKVRYNSAFWVLLFIYSVGVYTACSLGTVLMNATVDVYSSEGTAAAPIINIYDFPDVWHNLTYMASYLKLFLGIVVIISIANEKAYRTLRQNIIDGIHPMEFMAGKLLKIVLLTIVASLLVLGLVYYFGYRFSETTSWEYASRKMEFVLAFFVQNLTFLTMSMFIAIIFRSIGLAIVFTIAYSLFLETIIRWIFLDSEGIIANLLPIRAIDNLIQLPFNMLNPEDVQTMVEIPSMIIAMSWTTIFIGASYFLLAKRDL